MKNYISINNQKIELTDEQVRRIIAAQGVPDLRLAEVSEGETVKIGGHEFVVLEHAGAATSLILKNLLAEDETFGETNNYDGSNVDELCNAFADELAAIVGEEKIVVHTVDLTSDDGLKDYGEVTRRASLLTADLYRRYVEILDKYNPKQWWWLATAHSTKRHENDSWVKCVSPSGLIYNYGYFDDRGARPFCILKSDIFVSK